MMRGHRVGLSNAQMKTMKSLSRFIQSHGFYLAGGTAVAIRLGHRRSIDLDYFCTDDFDEHALAKELRTKFGVNVQSLSKNTINCTLNRVSISFMTFRHEPLGESELWAPFRTPIASEADLITMKLNAIVNRGLKKDFIDLYALLESGWTLKESISLFQSRFGLSGAGHLFRALTYFDEANREPTPKAIWQIDWRVVKSTIRKEVEAYLRSIN